MATKVLFKGYSSKTSIRKLKDMDLAKQDLTNHFNTKKGERLMDPSYGSLIWDLLFEPYDDTVEDVIKEDCIDIVSQDPRWNLREVVTYSNQNAISIQMRLKYTPTDQEDILSINFDRNLSEAK